MESVGMERTEILDGALEIGNVLEGNKQSMGMSTMIGSCFLSRMR